MFNNVHCVYLYTDTHICYMYPAHAVWSPRPTQELAGGRTTGPAGSRRARVLTSVRSATEWSFLSSGADTWDRRAGNGRGAFPREAPPRPLGTHFGDGHLPSWFSFTRTTTQRSCCFRQPCPLPVVALGAGDAKRWPQATELEALRTARSLVHTHVSVGLEEGVRRGSSSPSADPTQASL